MLEGLQPHQNLKSLGIHNFVALRFPSWLTNENHLQNLVSVVLRGCNGCTQFPTLGQLPLLEVLQVRKMNAVTQIGSELSSTTVLLSPYEYVIALL